MRSALLFVLVLFQFCFVAASCEAGGRTAVGGAVVSDANAVRLAELGDPNAQTRVGRMFEMGRGVPQNYSLAVRWYLRAANQGHPGAQYLLALMFDRGFGVPADHIEAQKWMILAAAGAFNPKDAEVYVRMRNAIATKLTRYEKDEAQFRATTWVPVRER